MAEKSVLILCTGNSCRSQIAEAIVNHDLAGRWKACSAGTQPAGYVHPLAVKVLDEIGIHHQGESKPTDQFRGLVFDQVITVCDGAAENCPVWLGSGKKVHIGFPDPARAEGSDEEVLTAFRKVRDDIRAKIIDYLKKTEVLPTWAPRVKQELIKELYENDARGLLDEDLLSDVGWGLFSRCKSFLIAIEAVHGKALCPVCDAVILHHAQPDERLHCTSCGWECTWQAYFQTIQHKQLSGGEDVCALFQDYIDRFPKAAEAKEKMLLIDALIHGWHWNLIHKMDTKLNTRAVCVNLIEGRLHEVIEFLDQLSYGEGSTPGVYQQSQDWRQKLDQMSLLWKRDFKHK